VLNYFPKYFTNKAIALYFGVLVLVSIVFFKRILPVQWMIFGAVEVVGFFYFANLITRKWTSYNSKTFEKKLFRTSLILRIVWVVFSYFFYLYMTGQPFEFDTGDAFFYNKVADRLANGSFDFSGIIKEMGISDSGYIIYLSLLKRILGPDIIVTRLIKTVISSYTCVLIYRLGTRTFGEEVGRMSAIFCMVMPNLIYYTGLHLKETEMVFLAVLFIERTDAIVRGKQFKISNLVLLLFIVVGLFFLRTVLGATVLFALVTTLLLSGNKVFNMGKRTILIVWVALTVGYFLGGQINTELVQVWNAKDTNQEQSLDFRTTRENGNKFSKYASGAVFAPMIFVIPFPTIINSPDQNNQQLINGGNYVKNIMAFFTILSLFVIIKAGKWRDYLLTGSYTIGYLLVIALSAYAQSERFHMPALPFELMFAAYGISIITNKQKKYFTWWMILIFIAIVGWSWFKLAGRGMA
jgi:4-amino-4-deoxy-L-arabinose transferase-like glycosyltransferase